MSRSVELARVRRRDVVSFIGLILQPVLKLAMLTVFKPKKLGRLSVLFSDIYSRLWDFAEHSISHGGFNLPSSLGGGPVNRVNRLLAELYGGEYASLSFGGSSGALLTLLTAVLPKLHPDRDLILFDDVCHQSTIGGLIFGRWQAVRLVRKQQPSQGTVCPVTFKALKDIIERHGPDKFAAIILVSPSYDGFRSPSEERQIYDYAKRRGISVIIDGAWDALRFRQPDQDSLPLISLCDVWITSPHKRGLTPSSLGGMITNSETIARLWDEALDLGFRSSSVSFVEIMIAEHRLTQISGGDWDLFFEQADRAAKTLADRIHEVHPELHIVQPIDVQAETHDPTHLLISTRDIQELDARLWAETLAREFALDVEKATLTTLLLLCGSPTHLEQMDEIIFCLKESLNMSLKQCRSMKNDLSES